MAQSSRASGKRRNGSCKVNGVVRCVIYSTARSYSILPNGNPVASFELCTITDFYFLSTEVRNFRDPRSFNICGRFQHEHVVHLLAAHIFGVEAVVGFDEEAAHGDEGGFGKVEFRAAKAVVIIGRITIRQ